MNLWTQSVFCIVDILSVMESVQLVKTKTVEEMCDLETTLDADHAAELANLRREQTECMLNDIVANKEGLAADLQQEGQSDLH